MTADEVYRNLALEGLTVTSLSAQAHQYPARDTECNAHVEFQLTPSAVEGAIPPQFALLVRLSCHGTPARLDFGKRGERLFELELRAQATYRQTGSDTIVLSDFTTHHTIFARQLFPALVFRAQELLERLGLSAIRLPLDLPQEVSRSVPGPPVGALN